MSLRLENQWKPSGDVFELYDDDARFKEEGWERIESHSHNSTLLHTGGFFNVKVCKIFVSSFFHAGF